MHTRMNVAMCTMVRVGMCGCKDTLAYSSMRVCTAAGTSDPFVTVTYGKESRKTYVILKTLTPEWNQTFRYADMAYGLSTAHLHGL